MKRNAFTLIEVLTVIVILGVIAVIFVPNAIDILSQNETKIYKAKETMIETSAEDYVLEHKEFVLPENLEDVSYITLDTLVSNNYITKILDSQSGNECNGFVKVTKNSTYGHDYSACLLCSDVYTSNKDFCTTATYNSL